ncbi:MAG TPA: addiction module protein [Kofleriaceae bacterium]|nr:addiction module protein [Kofleriaceae bacterium]
MTGMESLISLQSMPPTLAEKLLEQALLLPPDEREELAARLLDSLESSPGISIDDHEEIEARADEARRGAPGVSWEDVKRTLAR